MVDADADAGFLLDYIREYCLLRAFRVGIALPGAGGQNRYLSPDDYRAAGQALMRLARAAAEQGVTIGMDCGFVPCMFTETEIGALLRLGAKINFTCRPVIDVGPSLEAWHCLPLARMPRVDVRKCLDLREVATEFARMASVHRASHGHGIFRRCQGCGYRDRGLCSGGCLALMASDQAALCASSPREMAENGDVPCRT